MQLFAAVTQTCNQIMKGKPVCNITADTYAIDRAVQRVEAKLCTPRRPLQALQLPFGPAARHPAFSARATKATSLTKLDICHSKHDAVRNLHIKRKYTCRHSSIYLSLNQAAVGWAPQDTSHPPTAHASGGTALWLHRDTLCSGGRKSLYAAH